MSTSKSVRYTLIIESIFQYFHLTKWCVKWQNTEEVNTIIVLPVLLILQWIRFHSCNRASSSLKAVKYWDLLRNSILNRTNPACRVRKNVCSSTSQPLRSVRRAFWVRNVFDCTAHRRIGRVIVQIEIDRRSTSKRHCCYTRLCQLCSYNVKYRIFRAHPNDVIMRQCDRMWLCGTCVVLVTHCSCVRTVARLGNSRQIRMTFSCDSVTVLWQPLISWSPTLPMSKNSVTFVANASSLFRKFSGTPPNLSLSIDPDPSKTNTISTGRSHDPGATWKNNMYATRQLSSEEHRVRWQQLKV